MNNRILELREKKDVSQSQLADAIGVSRQAISLYERGDREPKLKTWQKMADYFGVSVGYLQGLHDIENLEFNENDDIQAMTGRSLSYINENRSNELASYIANIVSDKAITASINNNLSSSKDRLLLLDLYKGVSASLGLLLIVTNGNIDKYRHLLADTDRQIKQLNQKINDLAFQINKEQQKDNDTQPSDN